MSNLSGTEVHAGCGCTGTAIAEYGGQHPAVTVRVAVPCDGTGHPGGGRVGAGVLERFPPDFVTPTPALAV